MVFHNRSNYNYHFIMKELAKEFERKFNCPEENTIKHKACSVPIIKEAKRISKNVKETTKTVSERLRLIDSSKCMASSLSNLVYNLAEKTRSIN